MTPRYAVYGLCALLAILAGLSGVDSCRRHQGAGSEHNAAVASGEANAHQSQAQAQDPAIADLQAKLADQAKIVARVSGERDALLKKWQARPIPVQSASNPTPNDRAELLEQLDLAQAVIEKDAEEIAKQDLLIKNQSELILVATKRGDEWKATAGARERQALAQEAATEAWKKAVTTSKWRGRIEGFAAGVALGYVGGRR